MSKSVAATNFRRKSISPWNQVWDVLCPDCNEIRSVKGARTRGRLVQRCRPCACKARHAITINRAWWWILSKERDIRTERFSAIPSIIVRCTDCGDPALIRKLKRSPRYYRCQPCGTRHADGCYPWLRESKLASIRKARAVSLTRPQSEAQRAHSVKNFSTLPRDSNGRTVKAGCPLPLVQ